MCLTYGEREAQAWNKIDELVETKVYPDNKNEILRRGLHVCAQLGEVEEKPLLDLLYTYLEYAIKDENDSQYITIAKNLWTQDRTRKFTDNIKNNLSKTSTRQ